jgi:hypothetical protein
MNFADFFTSPNGFPIESDATLGFMQTDYQNAIRGLAAAFAGDGVIVSGMVDSGAAVTDGWIYVGGDLVRFLGGAKQTNYFIESTVVSKANQSGALVPRYTTKVAKFGSGPGAVAFSTLVRLESLFSLQNKVLDALTQESTVILSGCVVSSINTGASTLSISAGTAIINRKFVNAPAYSGGYPVYLNDIGQWVNTPPAQTITFNPHTSQRLRDVNARQGAQLGEVKMLVALSDRFDNTGLGRWEYLGWAICNGANGTVDLRSRFVVQYDPRTSDPGGNIWEAGYNTPGNVGGSRQHILTIAEMPTHNHTDGSGSVAAGSSGLMRRSQSGENNTVADRDTFSSGSEPDLTATPTHVPSQGGGQGHENRPPFRVMVFIQRV